MGAIQNNFNQLLSLTAGAITLGKHISNEKKSLAEQEWANKNSALDQAEKFNEQAGEFNEEHKNLLETQTADKLKSNELKRKIEGVENAPEGTYTEQGKKMLETKYQNALESLRENQLQTTRQLKDLSERRDILKQRRELVSQKVESSGLKDVPVKPVLGDNKDLLNKINKYRKQGGEA